MVAMNVWPTDGADGSVATEARWRKMARHYLPSGVLRGIGLELAPSLAGTNLTVRSGSAWVDGHFAELLGDQVLTVTANGLAVVRFDPAANSAELVYRDAATVPAQSPTGIWELPIAKIVASALTDMRRVVDVPGAPQGLVKSNLPTGYGVFTIGTTATAMLINPAVNLRADRTYRVDVIGAWESTGTGGTYGIALTHTVAAGAPFASQRIIMAADQQPIMISGFFSPTADGPLVFILAATLLAGSGQLRALSSGTFHRFVVTDVGPASALTLLGSGVFEDRLLAPEPLPAETRVSPDDVSEDADASAS